jgi:MFS family permease
VRSGGSAPGRQFGWLWAAYGVSTIGTWLAFDAFPLIAIRVLHSGPAAVSALAAAGLAVGAVVAVPLGPWMEFRRKRPVMMATDLIRFAALMTIPAAYALGALGFAQLVVVAVIVGAADITFKAASGAFLKSLVPPGGLLTANARFESTAWTATVLGPPLGGAAIGLFGPVLTVLTNAASFLLSALSLRAIGGHEPHPTRDVGARKQRSAGAEGGGDGRLPQAGRGPMVRRRASDLLDGWRYILAHPALRALFFNTVLVNSLIMATAPLLAVLMLGRLGFAPWQYGLAFGVPCIGGLIGSRLSRPLAERFGRQRVMLIAGTLRSCWSVALAFVGPGVAGLVLVIVAELALITSVGVFNPVLATVRLEQTAVDRVARTLSAWSITNNAVIAAMTALWGLLAAVTSPRAAIGIAGVLMLATPLLLPRGEKDPRGGSSQRDEESRGVARSKAAR